MRQYAAALDGVKAQATNIGAGRTVAGTVNALVAAYLDPAFKLAVQDRRPRDAAHPPEHPRKFPRGAW